MGAQRVALIAVAALLLAICAARPALASVHTVFTTECGIYFTWQALGMVYSHKKSGQPGKITRLISCTDSQWEEYPDKDLVPTHRAPSYTTNPHNQDHYSAYNKPEAVIHWLANNVIEEEFVLILDADMVMRAPFIPQELGAKKGLAISAFYGYLEGVSNALALKHVPEVLPRNDTLAGPKGRRGDQVGGFILMHQEDLRRMAPMWLKYSEDVRFDPDAWNLTGDVFATHPGDRPWISEMYGYSFAAAKADVWHKSHLTAMIYPGYKPLDVPKVLHYGLEWYVDTPDKYRFDKHDHYGFRATHCPPWNFTDGYGDLKGGLFRRPPRPTDFQSHGLKLLQDLLSIEVVVILNEAMCEHHRKHCPPSEELARECQLVDEDAELLADAYKVIKLPNSMCEDTTPECTGWKERGECENNVSFMLTNCRRACGMCHDMKGTLTPKRREGAQNMDGAVTVPDLLSKDTASVTDTPPRDVNFNGLVQMSDQPPKQGDVIEPEHGDKAHRKNDQRKRRQRKRQSGKHAADTRSLREAMKRLSAKCTSNDRLSLTQVKACLELAREGKEYLPAAPRIVTDQGTDDAGQLQRELREQAAKGDAAQPPDDGTATSRRLSHKAEVTSPDAVDDHSPSFLAKVGGIGLMLWCGAVLLFLCLLPKSRRGTKNRMAPYRHHKRSIL